MEARLRTDGREEGESDAGESEMTDSRVRREEVDGRGERTRRDRRAREVEEKIEGCGWKRGGRGGCKETEEEEKAVAVIAGVLREKFGPQIVREEEEEEGFANGRITVKEDAKGRHEEDEVGYGDEESEGSEAEAEEDEEGNEGGDAEAEPELEAEAEASEEDAPPTTSPPTRPPPLNSPRVVSPSSLLSLYRFFSSHLGISSPSTVASLLASHPALLRSDPASDLLPRVRLLQSYGISQASIVHVTIRNASWLRSSLPQIQGTIEFILARGVRRSKLGMVIRGSSYLIRSQARSTNLDILVEAAGIPEEKLAKLQFFVELVGKKAAGRVVRSHPLVLTLSKENLQGKVAVLSGLIGPDNSALAVARFPLLLTSGEETMKQNYGELLREFQEALERGGGDEGGIERQEARGIGEGKDGNGDWDGNMRHKVEYLKREMGLSIMEVLAFPPFLGFNLHRRIKMRHAALLRLGYEVVPHKVVALRKLGSNRKGVTNGSEVSGRREEHVDREGREGRADVGNGEDEWQEEEGEVESSELLVRPHEGNDEPRGRGGLESAQKQQAKKPVCLSQFLSCSDKRFEDKFLIEL
ncbi:unnamed protein product [Closterium sp. Naga37s-1]|nr:unnamed protein product [Closterium sp. Naga37s-1]